MNTTITHIIKQCAVGNEQAYRALVDAMSSFLMTTACRYVSYDDAKDVLQDSYIHLFKALKKTKLEEGNESQYIHRIVINNCLKKIRKQKVDFNLAASYELQEIETPIVLDQFASERIISLINKLPKACRLCFQLYEIDGYSHKEIGEKLNISDSTSRAHLSRAKKLLQSKISVINQVEKLKLERI